jgi:type II secretory pathway component PulK
MSPFLRSPVTRRGSALLLVLWAIMLMGFAVIGLVKHLSRGLDESIAAEKDFRARLLLESARTVAAHPAILRGDPLLRQELSPVRSWEVTLSTEGCRLAVNQLASSRLQRRFARQLFENWGIDPREALALVDSLADWIDPDSTPLPQGAEREIYTALERPDFPYNKTFTSLDDILLVRGADVMDRQRPDWRDFFTLYGDGTIDVHTASSVMLEALLDVTPSEVSRLVRERLGPDGQPGTEDDRRFTSLTEVRSLLDVPEMNYRRASGLLTLAHPIRRTECLAHAGGLERRLTLIEGPGLKIIQRD